MNRMKGLTIVELMMTLAIVSILVMVAIPGMTTYVKNDRLRSNVNALIGHLAYARSEAVKRSQQVSICASNDSTSCSGTWNDGWILYADADGNNSLSAGEEILRVHETLGTDNTLAATGIGTQISYDYRGFARAGSVGSLQLCDDRSGPHGRTINITTTGRVRLETDSTC